MIEDTRDIQFGALSGLTLSDVSGSTTLYDKMPDPADLFDFFPF